MRYCSLLFLWCICLSGQTVTREARDLALSTTRDAGTTIFHLRNEYRSPATSWIVECHGQSDPGKGWTSQWYWSDQEIGLDGKPLQPGKETEFRNTFPKASPMMGGQDPGSCENFQLVAAIFADGSVTGEFRWINAIIQERQKVYQDLTKATDLLHKAISEGTDRTSVIKKLTEWRDSEPPGAMGPKAYANYFVTWGRLSRPSKEGPHADMLPVRPASRAAVTGVSLWLIQEKETSFPDTLKSLSEWQDRLGQIKAVTGAPESMRAGFTPPAARSGVPNPADYVGKPAVDFTLKDAYGQDFAFKDLHGKTVFLNFWATWCEPCIAEMPEIEALQKEFKDSGLVVVCIDPYESADIAKKYFDEHKYPFVNLVDVKQTTFEKYGDKGVPKTVLIDKDGIVRFYQQGGNSNQDFRRQVLKLGLQSSAPVKVENSREREATATMLNRRRQYAREQVAGYRLP